MSVQQEALSLRVSAFIDSTHQSFLTASENTDPQAIAQATAGSLKNLAAEFGTSDYSFNYSIEHYVEHFCELIHDVLPRILSDYLPRHAALARPSEETDIAFVAYYAMSLIYKKEDKEEELRGLISDKYSLFTRMYPLAFEVRSRYFKRVRKYEEALESDEQAIEFLEAQDIQNYALGISYAATVCRMYEKGYAVEAYQSEYAERYINAAITYNPEYPKYHFLRGKLLLYSRRGIQDTEQFNAICDEALACVKKARRLQMGQPGAHFEKALREYNDLKVLIIQERSKRKDSSLPFRHMSERELRESIQAVLSAREPKEVLPPNPNLKPGQKFIFISYSHQDFKSVYCDLLALYANKVPFQYDGGLPKGTRWDTEVHSFISKEECAGVVFFVGQNTVLSEAIERECRLVSENGKRYFSVNLEGNMPPSKILMNSILRHGVEKCCSAHVDNDRMVSFLTTFHDDITFVPKDPVLGESGSDHIPELISSIRQTFPMLEIGDRSQMPAGV